MILVPLPKSFTDCILLNHVDVFDLSICFPDFVGEGTEGRGIGQPRSANGT